MYRCLEPKFWPPLSQKSGCGEGYTWWTQISTLSNHSLYLWWDIGRVEMLWNSWTNPNILHLGVKCKGPGAESVTTNDSKARLWRRFYMMKSNLILAQPFIIHTMRHWKGWDAVNCPNKSKLTQSWCEKLTRSVPTLTPPVTEKKVAVTISDPIYQSQPSPTIHYMLIMRSWKGWDAVNL